MPNETLKPGPKPRYGRYLLWVALLSLLLYPLPYFIIRAPYYDLWTTAPYGKDLEYGMTTKHIDADVLIYGDSTALYGLSPRRMSQELGLKVFNLPNVLPSLRTTGDLEIRNYLANNKPPRLLVIYLAPWDLNYGDYRSNDVIYDGEEMLLRHGNFSDIWHFARRHPDAYLQFPFIFYRVQNTTGFLKPNHELPAVAATQGQRVIVAATPLPADCTLPANRTQGHLPMRTAQDLYNEFHNLPAIVYVAPIPNCAGASVVAADDYSSLHAPGPHLLPGPDFEKDGYYLHPLATKVNQVTDQLVEALRPRLAEAKQ